MKASRSDALVLFGVTGDLTHKMIFPALYAMVKRGTLEVPVIGVALPTWSLARLHKRVTESIERSGGVDNQRALHHLLSLLKYVSGNYDDPNTFTAIESALGSARRPAHYLAIPPSLLAMVLERCAGERARRGPPPAPGPFPLHPPLAIGKGDQGAGAPDLGSPKERPREG